MYAHDDKQIEIIDKEVLPDKTLVVKYEYTDDLDETFNSITYTVSDIILILLYSHYDKPINGRLSIMKQVFFSIEEVFNKKNIQDAKYVPYRYGMYSFLVGNNLDNLEYLNYIQQNGKKNTKLEQFKITKKGINYIKNKFMSLSPNLQNIIRKKRKGWDQLGYDGILRLAYQKYPKYIEHSEIKKRYMPIKWGRGIG